MAALKLHQQRLFLELFVIVSLFGVFGHGLKVGYYAKTCPQAETIVRNVVHDAMSKAPSLGGPLLRIFFHDCFVRGCDGSLLLDLPKNQTEKSAPPNLTLRGFEVYDRVKAALEKACPGVVSCADIVALVARDTVFAAKGPWWEVETGRRDGRTSSLNEAMQNLPPPFFNFTQLKALFGSKGLSVKDLVVLSGGHTLGTAHCFTFTNRLYNFTGRGDSDPNLDSEYAVQLRKKCQPNDRTTIVEMDPGSFRTFDGSYYTLVSKRRGIFQSDAALLTNPETKKYVTLQSRNHKASFFKDFRLSMVKMGRIQVLTGRAGEIRKMCRRVN